MYMYAYAYLAAVVKNVDWITDTVCTVVTDPTMVCRVHCWTIAHKRHHRLVCHVRLYTVCTHLIVKHSQKIVKIC